MIEKDWQGDQQWLNVKHWLQRYGIILLITIFLIVGIGVVVAVVQRHHVHHTEEASLLYDDILARASHPTHTEQEKMAKAVLILQERYAHTPYAALATLLWASALVESKSWLKAKSQLNWAIQHASIPGFKQIARLNLARLLWFQKEPKQALACLKTVEDSAYQPMVDTLRQAILSGMDAKIVNALDTALPALKNSVPDPGKAVTVQAHPA